MSIAEPKFTRALQEGGFELRGSAATVVAGVTVPVGPTLIARYSPR